jgi:hypothetical protein
MKVIPEKIIKNCAQCTNDDCTINIFKRREATKSKTFPLDCPLKDYEPDKWLDKPDSEGWWWYKNERLNRLEICKVEHGTDNKNLQELYKILLVQSYFTDGYVLVENYDKGKWLKIPEPKEE